MAYARGATPVIMLQFGSLHLTILKNTTGGGENGCWFASGRTAATR